MMSLTADDRNKLARLGYDPLWTTAGVLSRELLLQQIAAFEEAGADQNTEHYRAAALHAFLSERSSLTNGEIEIVLQLGSLDPDRSFRSNFPHSLIRFPNLSDQQFELIAASFNSAAFNKVVARFRWLRVFNSGSPSEAQFENAISGGDPEVQRAILDRKKLPPRIAELLATQGANRAIRNAASALSRRRVQR